MKPSEQNSDTLGTLFTKNRLLEIESGNCKSFSTLRKYLLAKHGNVCTICKEDSHLGHPIPLEMDHIDGHRTNNHLINLRMICRNCHAQTPTYKKKNNGNGCEKRRAYYHNSKNKKTVQ